MEWFGNSPSKKMRSWRAAKENGDFQTSKRLQFLWLWDCFCFKVQSPNQRKLLIYTLLNIGGADSVEWVET